jgi:hypothetical protein
LFAGPREHSLFVAPVERQVAEIDGAMVDELPQLLVPELGIDERKPTLPGQAGETRPARRADHGMQRMDCCCTVTA